MSSFDRTPRGMYDQVSNNEHAMSHHLTRLNVEFVDLIATCNIFLFLADGMMENGDGAPHFSVPGHTPVIFW